MFFGFGFDGVVEKPWCRGHVQTTSSLDVVGIMDSNEIGFIRSGECDAGGAVSLVADNEVEIVEALRLSIMNSGQGLVGGKDDVQTIGALSLREKSSDVVAISGDRDLEVVRGNVFGLAAGLVIGANREALQI